MNTQLAEKRKLALGVLEELLDQTPITDTNIKRKEVVYTYLSDVEKERVAVEEELEEQKEENTTLESKISDLREENDSHTSERNEIENQKDEALEKLSDAELPENLYDEQKHEVCKRLMKNMTLGNIEYLESLAKNMITNYKMD